MSILVSGVHLATMQRTKDMMLLALVTVMNLNSRICNTPDLQFRDNLEINCGNQAGFHKSTLKNHNLQNLRINIDQHYLLKYLYDKYLYWPQVSNRVKTYIHIFYKTILSYLIPMKPPYLVIYESEISKNTKTYLPAFR